MLVLGLVLILLAAGSFVAVLARLLTRHGNRVGAMLYGGGKDSIIPTRSGRTRRLQLASGATGDPRRPARVGRAMSRSRSGTPWSCLSRARAWLLISAIFTPCGHTCVQMPQLLQRSREASGDGPSGAR